MQSLSDFMNTQGVADLLTAVLAAHKVPRSRWGDILHEFEGAGWNWFAFEEVLETSPIEWTGNSFIYLGDNAEGEIRELLTGYLALVRPQ